MDSVHTNLGGGSLDNRDNETADEEVQHTLPLNDLENSQAIRRK